MAENLKLSILDIVTMHNQASAREALQNSAELVQLADRLGYTRYWFAEHHNQKNLMSTSPDIMSAHTAANSENIRIGTGGTMLPNHSSLKVAENFSFLEALYPGRIDLGIGRAPGTDVLTANALRRNSEESFSEQLEDLLSFFKRDFSEEHPYRSIIASPDDSLVPDIYMLGSSEGGMSYAAEHGLGFVFARHIAPDLSIEILREYREKFKPSSLLSEPKSIMSVIVVAADTDEEAEYLAGPAELQWVRWTTGELHLAPPTLEEAATYEYTMGEEAVREENKGKFVIGSVENVEKQLRELAEEAMVDEIMIVDMLTDKKSRHRSYELLAETFKLTSK